LAQHVKYAAGRFVVAFVRTKSRQAKEAKQRDAAAEISLHHTKHFAVAADAKLQAEQLVTTLRAEAAVRQPSGDLNKDRLVPLLPLYCEGLIAIDAIVSLNIRHDEMIAWLALPPREITISKDDSYTLRDLLIQEARRLMPNNMPQASSRGGNN
jgi:hypothetical protein